MTLIVNTLCQYSLVLFLLADYLIDYVVPGTDASLDVKNAYHVDGREIHYHLDKNRDAPSKQEELVVQRDAYYTSLD